MKRRAAVNKWVCRVIVVIIAILIAVSTLPCQETRSKVLGNNRCRYESSEGASRQRRSLRRL